MKTTEDSNTLVFIMDIKKKYHIYEEALQHWYGQVNTLIRADGGKVYVQQAPHCNALDVAPNKIEIISCLISNKTFFIKLKKPTTLP